jgi:transposase InsO family protein
MVISNLFMMLKKDILINDFQNYQQQTDIAIREAFVDYNQNRIHSSLGYLTPYEFISKLKTQVINNG